MSLFQGISLFVTFAFAALATQSSFVVGFLNRPLPQYSPPCWQSTTTIAIPHPPNFHTFPLRMTVGSSTGADPFAILNLNPTADKKEIKRAYKRMALKYHPDVACSASSSKEERKAANDRFAQINWAYQELSGKNGGGTASSRNTSGARTTTSTPPHRRKSSYSTSTTGSTDWRDYIPNYKEDEVYDTNGDSFGAIFSDLLGGVAAASAGSGGIFRDFVEFLEDNVDGYMDGGKDDDDLYVLLRDGTVEQVGMEMDDTELVVQSLESKKQNVADELLMKTSDQKFATKFSERVELEGSIAELEARKKVVDGYLTKARKRLLSLQARYKELIVGGADASSTYSRRSSGSYEATPSSSRNGPSSTRSRRDSSYSSTSSSSARTSERGSGSSTASGTNNEDDEWKHQGFGSSGRRGRGSSRRGRSRSRSTTASGGDERTRPSSSYEQPPPPPPRQESAPPRQESTPPREASRATQQSQDWKPPVPPHRRSKSEPSQAQKDKKTLRELQVDDEFDKLKRELGL